MYSEIDIRDTSALRQFLENHDVLLMGIMGAGKTTLVQHMQRQVPLRYVAQGEISRSIVEFDPVPSIRDASAQAKPWDFNLVRSILLPLLNNELPYVLDGLPKHPHEARWLLEHLIKRPRPTVALIVETDLATARHRVTTRRRGRTETEAEIDHRFATYMSNHQEIMKILKPVIHAEIFLDSTTTPPMGLIRQLATQWRSESNDSH